MTNRERIIECAIELFNRQGVGYVGTNKIASGLDISPGNLYYHFRNKEDIIRAVFEELDQAMDKALSPPESSETWSEAAGRFLMESLRTVWRYRFFYSDLVTLLDRDEELKAGYNRLMARTLDRIKKMYAGRVEEGLMTGPAGEAELDALVLNTWLIAVHWVRYLQVSKTADEIGDEDFHRGVFQVICLSLPYMTEETRNRTVTGFQEYIG